MSFHLYTNVGSSGSAEVVNLTQANVRVRNALVRLLSKIHGTDGIPVQSMSLVETGSYIFRPAPYFQNPLCTNENMKIVDEHGKDLKRKVCAYGPKSFKPVLASCEAKVESATFVNHWWQRSVRDQKLVKMQSGVITLYRNQNPHAVNGPTTKDDIRNHIQAQMAKLRIEHDVRKITVIGDFNFETMSLAQLGLTEIKDNRLVHKHNEKSQATSIDKVFSNHNDVSIANIYNTVENKSDENYGHKCVLLRFGTPVPPKNDQSKKSFSIRKFKKNIQNWNNHGLLENDETWKTKEEIDMVASGFIDQLKQIKADSMVTRKNSPNPCKLAIDCIEDIDPQTMKKPTELKKLARFFNHYKEGISTETQRPEHTPLHSHLKSKTDNLNTPNHLVRSNIINEIYGDSIKIGTKFPDQKAVKKALTRLSNSNALDIHNLSMKEVKLFLRNSKNGFRLFYKLIKSCAEIGYFPLILKLDKIIFLFKNKGSRLDASKYRPITLAPALGKVLEKVIGIQLERCNDQNSANHAYTTGKSCQSAIIEVSEFFRNQRVLTKNSKNFVYVPLILCEDISSAFESIDSKCLVDIINNLFSDTGEFKLAELVNSYMTRKIYTCENGELMELVKKEITRSAPQGSILSPRFWRLFDCLFSRLYTNDVEDFIDKVDFIRSLTHVSYADDHLTAMLLKFPLGTDKNVIKEKITEITMTCRSFLDTATRDVGCGINELKSEVIVPDEYTDSELKSKSGFTWLGYSLHLSSTSHLRFSPDKATAKFIATKLTINDIFQHINSTFARWKIYKVFVAPVLEWFMLTMFDKPFKDSSASNPAETFQQDILCQSIKICRNVNRFTLEKFLHEKPVKIKMQLMAVNLAYYLQRDIKSISSPHSNQPAAPITRSGRNADINRWPRADPKDLGDRLLIFKQIHKETPKEVFDFYKEKFTFNPEKVKEFTDKTNRAISTKINERRDERAASMARNSRKRNQILRCRSLGRNNVILPYSEPIPEEPANHF